MDREFIVNQLKNHFEYFYEIKLKKLYQEGYEKGVIDGKKYAQETIKYIRLQCESFED